MSEVSQSEQVVSSERLIEAYAKSIAIYYAAEKAFQAQPTGDTLHAYHVAVARLRKLRSTVDEHGAFADALLGTESNESVGR